MTWTRWLRSLALATPVAVGALGVAGCPRDERPDVDEAAQELKDKTEEAVEDTREAVDEATDEARKERPAPDQKLGR